MDARRHGFTLVELAIVLVIIGLMVGGVFVGRDLIRASELHSLTADTSRYLQGVQNFRTRYAALPGDMKNATRHWGIAGGTTGRDTTCGTTASTDASTCDDDGDGIVEGIDPMTTLVLYENLRF